jgi:hypothetical protein
MLIYRVPLHIEVCVCVCVWGGGHVIRTARIFGPIFFSKALNSHQQGNTHSAPFFKHLCDYKKAVPFFSVKQCNSWLTDSLSLTHSLTHLLTHSLIPWSRGLLEKLNVSQLVKKFPAFYVTRRFISSFTIACHLSLSWASSIQSMPPIPLLEDPL